MYATRLGVWLTSLVVFARLPPRRAGGDCPLIPRRARAGRRMGGWGAARGCLREGAAGLADGAHR